MIGGKTLAVKRYSINVLMLFLGLLAILPIYVLLVNSTRDRVQINRGFTFAIGKDAFFSTTSTIVVDDWDKDDIFIDEIPTATVYDDAEEDADEQTGGEAEVELDVLTEDELEEYIESIGKPLKENEGIAIFLDLEEGFTLRKEINKKTGELEIFVNKPLTESRSPRIEIFNTEGKLLTRYLLTNNAQIFIEDGQIVEKGQMIAKTVKPSNVAHNWRALTERGSGSLNIVRGFTNSAFIAICTTLLSIYFSALTAYGLHIYQFKGRSIIWGIILLIMMLPGSLTFIGFYQLMNSWKLINTFYPLILPGIAAAATVLFIRQYMSSVLNKELIDAARIDGAAEFRIFNIVILPVIVPALAAQAIFTFVGSWNNFLMPAVMLAGSPEKHTLPMIIMALRGDIYRTEVGGIYLGIAVSLIPIMIFYAFMSRFIISGITMGGIKE